MTFISNVMKCDEILNGLTMIGGYLGAAEKNADAWSISLQVY